MRTFVPSKPERTARRIDDKIDRSGGPLCCHPWNGAVSEFGNPQIPIVNGSGKKSSLSARRFMWEQLHGELPKTRRVRVTCENLLCMNMAHWTLEPVKDPVPRFWKNVNKLPGDGCWEWMATRTADGKTRRRGAGYGGFMHPWTKRVQAHRFSYELAHGPIPDGLVVMHICDNPPCVRPDHLKLGTMKDNMQDKIAKGRAKTGRTDMTRKQIVHVLREGWPLCGFSQKLPGEWPTGHQWVREDDVTEATCRLCLGQVLATQTGSKE